MPTEMTAVVMLYGNGDTMLNESQFVCIRCADWAVKLLCIQLHKNIVVI